MLRRQEEGAVAPGAAGDGAQNCLTKYVMTNEHKSQDKFYE